MLILHSEMEMLMMVYSSHLLKDMPEYERPRERMLQYGVKALSHSELLAILLRTGSRQQSALQLAQNVLIETEGIRGLMDFSLDELVCIKGIGPAKAIQIKAGIELGHRISQSKLPDKTVIRRPEDAANYVMEQLRYLQKEHFICLFLNIKNHIIAQETLSIGSLNASIVHPREVFRAAIKCSSASIVCVHNHPSGDPTPSSEDILITNRLCEAGKLLGIDVLDHIVIGDGLFVSLKEQALM